jgi:hypothetical protein
VTWSTVARRDRRDDVQYVHRLEPVTPKPLLQHNKDPHA